jgi:hypothetical protein
MRTNSSSQRKQQAEPVRLDVWGKILSLLSILGRSACCAERLWLAVTTLMICGKRFSEERSDEGLTQVGEPGRRAAVSQ